MAKRRGPSAPEWQLILEEIRSLNRATLEAVLTFRTTLEARLDRVERESRERDDLLARAIGDIGREVRQHTSDLTELKRLALRHGQDVEELKALGRQHSVDIQELNALGRQHGAVLHMLDARTLQHSGALSRLEERVGTLEKPSTSPPS
jgi:hypothetical protein